MVPRLVKEGKRIGSRPVHAVASMFGFAARVWWPSSLVNTVMQTGAAKLVLGPGDRYGDSRAVLS